MNSSNLWPRLALSAGALTVAVVLAFGSGDSDDSKIVQVNPPKVIEVSTPEVSAPHIPPTVDAPEQAAAPQATTKTAPSPKAAETKSATASSGKTASTVQRRSGSTLVVQVAGSAPSVGSTVQLTRLVKQKMFGADITATLNIGVAEVKSVKGKVVTLQITEEQSSIVVDGKKTEHFKPQATIDLAW